MNNDIAIKVEGVSKSFKLPHEKTSSIKTAFLNIIKKKRGYEMQQVLKDISFEIKKGDFFGIVGRNGSGKSTLLKLLSGIYTPDTGSITVNGSLTPFIELGVGFNPELTGRENVYLNGSLLGFSRKEMSAMYDDIVEFAELEQFMDQKLKNYSSGMQVRLAFSIAIRSNSDILVLDEVLAVGDEAFQRKCNEYFEKIRKNKDKTVILVTHNMDSVRRYCNVAMLIVDGKVKTIGNPDKVANTYSDIFIEEQIAELEGDDSNIEHHEGELADVMLDEINIIQRKRKTRAVKFHEDFSINLTISSKSEYENLTMGLHVFDQAGRDIMAISTEVFGGFRLHEGKNAVTFNIQNIFSDGDYYINLAIEDNITKKLLLQKHELSEFSILGQNLSNYSKHSLTYPTVEAHFEYEKTS